MTWLYLLGFFGLMVGFHFWGQANLTTAALMYTPQWIIILPGLLLLLPVLLFDWKSLPFLLLACAYFGHSHLDFRFGGPVTPPSAGVKDLNTLRVVTWNRGQGKGASLQVVKNALHPDIVVLQDQVGKATYYKSTPEYSEFKDVNGAGEFVMLSRWPIVSVELLGIDRTQKGALSSGRAARFVVMAAGARIAIYNIHLQTPRGALESYKRGAFLYGIIGLPGTPWAEKRKSYQAFWDSQMTVAREIGERIRAETIPVLVCGDFNTPTFGPIYDEFAGQLQDAHLVKGSGVGYTFPGDTGNPLALFQPWLRLDQMFASSHWEIRRSEVIEAKAQHLPVVADFHLLPEHRIMGGDIPASALTPPPAPTEALPPNPP
ncbi:endonuclease/exonuclease/phosphatase family protein [Brevifollis gellanilyticus]|uniref:endonuclease/exonuclease/phosphatase family protein n=1 Tax=Brevifollis gellanilyticus TaxID=748831 RepID=UPI001C3FC206|nr:endonuclease/exonuclease/phosphatase family protein [Brevifollis gellanilyticus]